MAHIWGIQSLSLILSCRTDIISSCSDCRALSRRTLLSFSLSIKIRNTVLNLESQILMQTRCIAIYTTSQNARITQILSCVLWWTITTNYKDCTEGREALCRKEGSNLALQLLGTALGIRCRKKVKEISLFSPLNLHFRYVYHANHTAR